MLQNPFLLALTFAGIVAAVHGAKKTLFFRPAFKFLPVPFWCYFLPMLGATFGFFPLASPVYPLISRYLLPLCLSLLLIHVNLSALARLSRPALAIMAAGMLSIMVGAVFSYFLVHAGLPPEAWKAAGALSASWTGGSANLLAVKEALATPEDVFAPIVVVYTFMAYGWMAFLIFLSGFQDRFDRWNGVTMNVDLEEEAVAESGPSSGRMGFLSSTGLLLLICALLSLGSVFLADVLPVVGILTRGTWTILLVTTLSLAVSLTGWPSRFNAETPAFLEKWGTLLLYVLLVSMGAKAKLTSILEVPLFLVFGIVLLAVHGTLLFLAGRWLKTPLFLLAAASQACVGGTVSAPLVAAVYRPALSAVGLLLAILGNVVGTYLGLITAHICEWAGR